MANRCEVPVKKAIGSKFDKSNRDRRVALLQPKPKPNLNVKDLLPKVGDYIGHIKGRDFREERQYRNRQGMEVKFSLFDVKLT